MYRVQSFFTGSPVADGANALYFDAAEGTPGQAQSAAVFFWTGVKGLMSQFQHVIVDGTVDLVDEATGTLIDSTTGASENLVGIQTAAGLPPATQALMRLNTSAVVAGRRLKGRFFIPGLTEDSNGADGQIIAIHTAALEDLGEALITGADHQLVVWHRPVDGAGGSKAPVESVNVPGQWGVLRKRRPDFS